MKLEEQQDAAIDAICPDCEQKISESYSPDDARWSEVTGKEHCIECYESEIEYGATVVHLSPANEAPVSYVVSKNFGYNLTDGDDIDRDVFDVDAEGFATIADTVEVTNGADLWGMETDIREVAERLKQDHADGLLPFDAYVTIKQTGNFSVYMTVNVAANDAFTFDKWLKNELVEEQGE